MQFYFKASMHDVQISTHETNSNLPMVQYKFFVKKCEWFKYEVITFAIKELFTSSLEIKVLYMQ